MTPLSPRAVLIVVPDESWPVSGHRVTAERIRERTCSPGAPVDVIPLGDLDRRLEEGGIALLHAFHASLTGPAVLEAAEREGLPFVVTICGNDLDPGEDADRRRVEDVIAHAAGLLVFYPAALRKVAVDFPEALPKIHVSWPGVAFLEGPSLRGRLGIPPDAVVFTLPTPLRASKRPLFALPLLEKLQRKDPRLHFILAGPVVEETVGERAEREMRDLPWAHFLGTVPPDDMGSLYATSDIVMNTAETESLSDAVLEGMAAGLPPLVADNPGNREALGVLGPGRGYLEPTGILFQSEWAFLEGARRLLEGPSLRRSLGDAARRRVLTAFDADREAEQHLLLWQKAFAGHRDRRASGL